MPSLVRPRVLAAVGALLALSTVFTYRGGCAPVGGYDGPAGVRYGIAEWGALGAAYGNGCEAVVAPLPLAVGLVLLVVSALLYWDGRRGREHTRDTAA